MHTLVITQYPARLFLKLEDRESLKLSIPRIVLILVCPRHFGGSNITYPVAITQLLKDSPVPSHDSALSTNSKSRAVSIAGGVLGSVLGVALIYSAFRFYQRWRRLSTAPIPPEKDFKPSTPSSTPSPSAPSLPAKQFELHSQEKCWEMPSGPMPSPKYLCDETEGDRGLEPSDHPTTAELGLHRRHSTTSSMA